MKEEELANGAARKRTDNATTKSRGGAGNGSGRKRLTSAQRTERARMRRAFRDQQVLSFAGKRGGWRPGAGRKPLPEGLRKSPVYVHMSPLTKRRLDVLSELTGSTRSRVIEKMVETMYYFIYDDTNPLRR